MEQEELKSEKTNVTEERSAADYISAIQKLKENSVSKEDFENLQKEKAELLDALINGSAPAPTRVEEPKVDLVKLERNLWSETNDRTNMENFRDLLTLREELIKKGENDIFLPYGRTPDGDLVVPTEEDENKANHLAEYIEHCLDVADGDSDIFQNEFQRNLI